MSGRVSHTCICLLAGVMLVAACEVGLGQARQQRTGPANAGKAQPVPTRKPTAPAAVRQAVPADPMPKGEPEVADLAGLVSEQMKSPLGPAVQVSKKGSWLPSVGKPDPNKDPTEVAAQLRSLYSRVEAGVNLLLAQDAKASGEWVYCGAGCYPLFRQFVGAWQPKECEDALGRIEKVQVAAGLAAEIRTRLNLLLHYYVQPASGGQQGLPDLPRGSNLGNTILACQDKIVRDNLAAAPISGGELPEFGSAACFYTGLWLMLRAEQGESLEQKRELLIAARVAFFLGYSKSKQSGDPGPESRLAEREYNLASFYTLRWTSLGDPSSRTALLQGNWYVGSGVDLEQRIGDALSQRRRNASKALREACDSHAVGVFKPNGQDPLVPLRTFSTELAKVDPLLLCWEHGHIQTLCEALSGKVPTAEQFDSVAAIWPGPAAYAKWTAMGGTRAAFKESRDSALGALTPDNWVLNKTDSIGRPGDQVPLNVKAVIRQWVAGIPKDAEGKWCELIKSFLGVLPDLALQVADDDLVRLLQQAAGREAGPQRFALIQQASPRLEKFQTAFPTNKQLPAMLDLLERAYAGLLEDIVKADPPSIASVEAIQCQVASWRKHLKELGEPAQGPVTDEAICEAELAVLAKMIERHQGKKTLAQACEYLRARCGDPDTDRLLGQLVVESFGEDSALLRMVVSGKCQCKPEDKKAAAAKLVEAYIAGVPSGASDPFAAAKYWHSQARDLTSEPQVWNSLSRQSRERFVRCAMGSLKGRGEDVPGEAPLLLRCLGELLYVEAKQTEREVSGAEPLAVAGESDQDVREEYTALCAKYRLRSMRKALMTSGAPGQKVADQVLKLFEGTDDEAAYSRLYRTESGAGHGANIARGQPEEDAVEAHRLAAIARESGSAGKFLTFFGNPRGDPVAQRLNNPGICRVLAESCLRGALRQKSDARAWVQLAGQYALRSCEAGSKGSEVDKVLLAKCGAEAIARLIAGVKDAPINDVQLAEGLLFGLARSLSDASAEDLWLAKWMSDTAYQFAEPRSGEPGLPAQVLEPLLAINGVLQKDSRYADEAYRKQRVRIATLLLQENAMSDAAAGVLRDYGRGYIEKGEFRLAADCLLSSHLLRLDLYQLWLQAKVRYEFKIQDVNQPAVKSAAEVGRFVAGVLQEESPARLVGSMGADDVLPGSGFWPAVRSLEERAGFELPKNWNQVQREIAFGHMWYCRNAVRVKADIGRAQGMVVSGAAGTGPRQMYENLYKTLFDRVAPGHEDAGWPMPLVYWHEAKKVGGKAKDLEQLLQTYSAPEQVCDAYLLAAMGKQAPDERQALLRAVLTFQVEHPEYLLAVQLLSEQPE